jgi:urease accessory protein
MRIADPVHLRGWRAELELDYERRGARTVLAARRHDGPLVVQKPLYPEGDAVCHTLVVHPPAGIAGGDELAIAARLGSGARALFTMPGASRWYRSAGPWARQSVCLTAGSGACLEWLPQETIVFDGALADMRTEVHLAPDAIYVGWEVLCLGRTGSGERYRAGECRLATEITRNGAPLWLERGRVEAGGRLAASPAGFGNRTVCGTLLAAAPAIPAGLLQACREDCPASGEGAATQLPGLLVARYLGDSSEAAKDYFTRLWRRLRPALSGRDALEPRIWRT